MLSIAAVVFDFDGVLVESVDLKTRAFAALYEEHGKEVVSAVVAHHLAHGGLSRYDKFRHYHRAFLGRELSREEERDLGERFSMLVEDGVAAAAWVPGAREFLEAYHARLPLFVASGTPDAELRRIVDRRGMSHFFVGVRGSPDSKAEIISAFVAQHALCRESVLMVGDSITDFEGARLAGIRFVGISRDPESFPGAQAVLSDLSRLGELVLD